jgi:hypothetical protein
MRSRLAFLVCALTIAALLVTPLAGSRGQKLKFSATFTAPTHSPKPGVGWKYAVYVRNRAGFPIVATAKQQVLLGTRKIDVIGWNKFRGVWRRTYVWPREDRGKPLTFQVLVVGPGGTKRLNYAVRVQ